MSTKPFQSGLMWFRRDLRTDDNTALFHALASCERVYCVFLLDVDILQDLPRQDMRVEFIRESLVLLDKQLQLLAHKPGAGLIVRHARAASELPALARSLGVQAVFTNHDYEPFAIARDASVRGALADAGISFRTYKDQVVFEREEVMTQMGRPYGVYTPYSNAWRKALAATPAHHYDTALNGAALAEIPAALRTGVPTLQEFGFERSALSQLPVRPGAQGAQALLKDFLPRMERYQATRDFPSVKGPSYLSVHLRFGTVSVRQLVREANARAAQSAGAETWLKELIWRDFYAQILANFPHVVERSFKREYDAIQWESGAQAEQLFAAWCEGRTGYPLVDAAMAQLNQTGYMHNRLRMVTASFLVKDLGIDWRWGERYFAIKLIDFDLASNNGGWQWASSSGCDAQPYFRIFNPTSQSEKFDAQGKFIRKYLPQLTALPDAALHAPWDARPLDLASAGVELGRDYPLPIVQHADARARTLARYAVVKKSAEV